MPSADVATSALTSLRRNRPSSSSRSSVGTADEYAATSKPRDVSRPATRSVSATVST